MTKEPYECPRCGYQTHFKSSIRKHLYGKKKTCQGVLCDIALSEEIKQIVIMNRKYKVNTSSTVPTQFNVYQQTNNYTNMSNFICKMDVIDKLSKYIQHRKEPLYNFDDHVTLTYEQTIDKLDNDFYKDFCMNKNTFLDIVDTLTTCEKIEKINILYDETSQRLRFVELGAWKSKILILGVNEIMRKIQLGYLDYYEEYLLRKLIKSDGYMSQVVLERLGDYYKFIVCFDLEPSLKHIVYSDNPKTESAYKLYKNTKNEWCKNENCKVRNSVTDIITKNCKASIIDLNKTIMELIQVDETFKQHVLNQFIKLNEGLQG